MSRAIHYCTLKNNLIHNSRGDLLFPRQKMEEAIKEGLSTLHALRPIIGEQSFRSFLLSFFLLHHLLFDFPLMFLYLPPVKQTNFFFVRSLRLFKPPLNP